MKGTTRQQQEDQFFFANNSKFKAPRINYIRPKQKTQGFVFGLVSPYTEHKSEGRRLKVSDSSSNAIESDDIEFYYNQVKGLKVLKNFGSKVKSVEEKRGTGIEAAVSGFDINFEGGDPCLYNPNLFYTSEI